MEKVSFAQKFTDIEYLSKKEVADQLGNNMADSIWRQVTEYREKYRFPLDVKRFDHIPFSIVITPSIMGISNSTERQMLRFAAQYEKYKNRQAISESKTLDQFKHDVIKEDLYVMSMRKDYKISEKDIEVMMDESSMHLKNTELYGFYEAHKYLIDHPSLALDKQLYKDLLSKLLGAPLTNINQVYRSQNNVAEAADFLAVPEYMNQLFEFYNSGFELSPFVIAAVLYLYIMYVQPFQKFNEELAVLTYMKVLQEAGYGEASYFLSIDEFILQKHGEFISQFEEIKNSGDLTYGVVFLSKLAYDAIVWRKQSLVKLPEPEPSYGNVRVIEKVVEKVVEKEVPVYIEKPVPQPIIHEIEKEPEVEQPIPEEQADIQDIQIQPFRAEEHPEEKRSTYEFEHDPFLKYEDHKEAKPEPVVAPAAPVAEPKPEPKITVVETVVSEKIEPVVAPQEVAAPIAPTPAPVVAPTPVVEPQVTVKPQIKPAAKLSDIPTDVSASVAELEGLEETEYARRLVEMQPLIKYRQALFYATHRVVGRYYSISEYKNFNECAYETARTSMDFLTAAGLYRKEQVKNKFVYTPVAIKTNA